MPQRRPGAGYRLGTGGVETCRSLRLAPAMRCFAAQRFCTFGKDSPRGRDRNGKEGVAGSSPAEGFTNRAAARFSCSWSGSGDHFLDGQRVAGPSECGHIVRRARVRGSRCGRPRRDHPPWWAAGYSVGTVRSRGCPRRGQRSCATRSPRDAIAEGCTPGSACDRRVAAGATAPHERSGAPGQDATRSPPAVSCRTTSRSVVHQGGSPLARDDAYAAVRWCTRARTSVPAAHRSTRPA